MIHDPMCPCKPCGRQHDVDIFSNNSSWACNDCQGMGECQCDLISKIEERSMGAQIDHYINGWEMAVAEIRQIVEFAAHKSDCVCYCCRCIQDDILACIDSLKGRS